MNKRILTILTAIVIASSLMTSCKKEDDDDNDTNAGTSTITGAINANRTLSADTIYTLNGSVVVESGATLTIQPGTILKFGEGTGANASALFIARGAKIMAQGTASSPIIMTSVLDDIELGDKVGTNLDKDDSGLWGGLIVLGKANISDGDGDTEGQIEGVPANSTYGGYGGSDNGDNSGIIQYVSIRHNGIAFKPDEELQGLTLGGVGSGTTINHVEVVASDDDGIEIFGGTVNLTDVLITYQSDDGLDLDQNYAGTVDNLVVLHEGGGASNAGFEFDGPEGTTHTTGKFTVKNATVKTFNNAIGRAATLKSGAQGTITNCVFEGYTNWVTVDGGSANTNFGGGELTMTNCEFVTSLTLVDLIASEEASSPADSTATINTFINSPSNQTVSTATKGANTSVFSGWTWTDSAGLL